MGTANAFRRYTLLLTACTVLCFTPGDGEQARYAGSRIQQALQVAAVYRKLDKPLTLPAGTEYRPLFRDALQVIDPDDELGLMVDERAFRGRPLPGAADETIFGLHRMAGIRRGTALRLLLSQVHAAYEIRGERVVIVPYDDGAATADRLTKARIQGEWGTGKKLRKTTSLPRGLDPNTPLVEALEYLSDRHSLTILIDRGAFVRAGIREIETQPVRLSPMVNKPLGSILQVLCDQVGATFEVHEDGLIVVPKWE